MDRSAVQRPPNCTGGRFLEVRNNVFIIQCGCPPPRYCVFHKTEWVRINKHGRVPGAYLPETMGTTRQSVDHVINPRAVRSLSRAPVSKRRRGRHL